MSKFKLRPEIQQFYEQGQERDRLKENFLERERTLRILQKSLPPAPAVILDVGGAAGVYAFPLAEQGYEVHLIDPVPLHIEQARAYAQASKIDLASYSVGDARHLAFADQSTDAVLLLGPLYHLVEHADRVLALKEAFRVVKQKGVLLAAAVSRFASLMDGTYQNLFSDPDYREMVTKDLATGHHNTGAKKYFTTAFFHHPNQLKEELIQSGFKDPLLYSVEGPVWHTPMLEELHQTPAIWEAFHSYLELIETDESIIGASAHFMARAKK